MWLRSDRTKELKKTPSSPPPSPPSPPPTAMRGPLQVRSGVSNRFFPLLPPPPPLPPPLSSAVFPIPTLDPSRAPCLCSLTNSHLQDPGDPTIPSPLSLPPPPSPPHPPLPPSPLSLDTPLLPHPFPAHPLRLTLPHARPTTLIRPEATPSLYSRLLYPTFLRPSPRYEPSCQRRPHPISARTTSSRHSETMESSHPWTSVVAATPARHLISCSRCAVRGILHPSRPHRSAPCPDHPAPQPPRAKPRDGRLTRRPLPHQGSSRHGIAAPPPGKSSRISHVRAVTISAVVPDPAPTIPQSRSCPPITLLSTVGEHGPERREPRRNPAKPLASGMLARVSEASQ